MISRYLTDVRAAKAALAVLLTVGAGCESGTVAATSAPVPAPYFGLHVKRPSSQWPDLPIGSIRLWDTGTSWAQIERQQNEFDWTTFDGWLEVAAQRRVEVLYTFGRTPQWAAASPKLEPCAYGPGHCSPPADLKDWDDFVRAVVRRAAGRIRYYELWNEPNLAKFFAGDLSTMVEMSRRAYAIIKSIDPQAQVLTPSPTFSTTYKVPQGKKGSDCEVWMDDFLRAGGGKYADIIAYHGYPDRKAAERSTLHKIRALRQVMEEHDQHKPLWDTEVSWGKVSDFPDPEAQAALLAKLYLLHWSGGVQRLFWYGWDYEPWGTLWSSAGGEREPARAYRQVASWMLGAVLTRPCALDGQGTWTCELQRGDGNPVLVAWSSDHAGDFTPAERYASFCDLRGSRTPVTSAVRISSNPILFETSSPHESCRPAKPTMAVRNP